MLGAVLLDARKAQRMIADVAGVVLFLGWLEGAGEVDGQCVVQPGLSNEIISQNLPVTVEFISRSEVPDNVDLSKLPTAQKVHPKVI